MTDCRGSLKAISQGHQKVEADRFPERAPLLSAQQDLPLGVAGAFMARSLAGVACLKNQQDAGAWMTIEGVRM